MAAIFHKYGNIEDITICLLLSISYKYYQ